MRLISSLIVCLGLSACATDYLSQLYEPNHGVRPSHYYSEETLDPTMIADGVYASKQMNGFYVSKPVCLTGYRCSQPAQQWSGWDP
jgi:hypothetical protein